MPHYRSAFIILAVASFAALPLQAQQVSTSSALETQPATPVIQSMVDQCAATDRCSGMTEPVTWKTLMLPIPGFKPGDQETHVYSITEIIGNNSSGDSAIADEYGTVSRQVAVRPDIKDEQTQIYLTAIDINTREARVTLDLHDVGLWPLVTSLQNALRTGQQRVANTGPPSLPVRPGSGGQMSKYLQTRLSIRGDNLTIEQVLDKVYQDTGCIVDLEEGALVIAGCP